MKRTLLGVLAFVLVACTLLSATVFAADEKENTANVGVVKMVDADHPIKVDGEMDEAYTTAVPLLINSREAAVNSLYTHGWARFVWSKAENALYCLVMMNDVEVAPHQDRPWVGDSVELFVDFTGTGTQDWGLTDKQISGGGALKRGLQYRIDGFKGFPTAVLVEELSSNGKNVLTNFSDTPGNVYWFSDEKGRLTNNDLDTLINDERNIFGWHYSEDPYKIGWGHRVTPHGYMVEYRIEASGQDITLKDGMKILFDLQVNDRYNVDASLNGSRTNVFYSSARRVETGMTSAGSAMNYYDYFTLSEEVVKNTYEAVAEAKLADYGMVDASEPVSISEKTTERTYTSKVTIDRVYTTRIIETGNKTTTGKNEDPGTTTKKDDTALAKGGCGGSITAGAAIAMLATTAAAGFFAFRKKED